jgi:hypothetical protein
MKNTKFVVLTDSLWVKKTGERHKRGATVDLGHLSADARQSLVDQGYITPATSEEAAAVQAAEKEA